MQEFTESFKKICQEAKLVGANFVVVKEDKMVNHCIYGMQSLEKNKATNEKTIYRIASISKTVGAIALMQLVEAKKIDLERDISDYFGFLIRNPKYPDDPITVKMLTLQTSSIMDGYDDENPAYDDIRKGYNGVNGTRLDVRVKDLLVENDGPYYTPLTFSDYKPGTRFIYSNFGCGLMACLIEIASGEYYTDYMENHIFKPLQLDASFVASHIHHQELIADLYYPQKDSEEGYKVAVTAERFVNGGYPKFPLGENFRGPAGGLFISMPDLSVIMRMFLQGGIVNQVRLLQKETVDYMIQQHWFGKGDSESYWAKGIQMKVLHSFPEKPFRGHTGGAYGVRSYMYFDVKNQLGVCFITNGGYREKETHRGIIDLFYDTLELVINHYWPKQEPKTEFTFAIGEKLAHIDQRIVKLPIAPFVQEEEIYLPAISLADGLNIVAHRNEEKDLISFTKKGLKIEYSGLLEKQGVIIIPLKKTLQALNIPFEIKGKEVKIIS